MRVAVVCAVVALVGSSGVALDVLGGHGAGSTAASAPVNLARHLTKQPPVIPEHGPVPGAQDLMSHATDVVPVKKVCGTAKPGWMQCLAFVRTDIARHKGAFAADASPSGYGPADLQSAYNLAQAAAADGKGETVAVVDAYDDPNAELDLGQYRNQYGLPACTSGNGCFTKIAQDGSTNYPPVDPQCAQNQGDCWAGEESLDLDMVSAICPDCNILLVEASTASFADLGAAVNEAVAWDNGAAKFVSNSYGSSNGIVSQEYSGETADDAAYYDHPGVAITASAGDYGYGVGFPAASPHVTAVGGTTLTQAPGTARGWSESVWNTGAVASGGDEGTGSGCSAYEPKPAWQTDTGCANRTVNDVSAVADPGTGVAVYDSYDTGGGWTVYGGTSAASPIIASAYALAGTPKAGTYPAQYPYVNRGALNDVTTGSDSLSGCSPAYLCTAGTGYDGPTGLGTPDGVAAFSSVPAFGDIKGTVTDSSGAPVAGATVSGGGGYVATTATDGSYDMLIAPGTYTVTASDYGYQDQAVSGVTVTSAGQTVTENFTLTPTPRVTVSGTVTDGSGHGWPLAATVQVADTPQAPVTTDPATGSYQLSLPANHSYTLKVNSQYYGYQVATQQVQVGASDTTADISLPIDPAACGRYTDGIGYDFPGTTETFDGRATPAGWAVTDNNGSGYAWRFDNPSGEQNLTDMKGDILYTDNGNYASLDTSGWQSTPMDATMTGPDTDLSATADPTLMWDNFSRPSTGTYSVDVSLDGGTTWQTVWKHGIDRDRNGDASGDWTGTQTVSLSGLAGWQASGKTQVRVRFHYAGPALDPLFRREVKWQVDNVFLGSGTCQPVPGEGLVVGRVGDKNTGAGVNQATLTSAGRSATAGPAYFNPGYADGFYAFTVPAGQQQVTAARFGYQSATQPVTVTANTVTKADFTLAAGQLKVSAPAAVTARIGGSPVSTTVAVTNTGTAPATIGLQQQDGGVTPAASPAAQQPAQWTRLNDFPVATSTSTSTLALAAATDPDTGIVYADADGEFLSWNPATGTYNNDLPDNPYDAGLVYATFINGQYYGVNFAGQIDSYDPRTNTWSRHSAAPASPAGSAYATLNGRIYVIGGCEFTGEPAENVTECFTGPQAGVQVYDPVTDTWSTAASYPEPAGFASCGTIGGEIYCAGGTNDKAAISSAYAYNPVTGAWKPLAPMPVSLWGAASSAANGKLLVTEGLTADQPAPSGGELSPAFTGKGFSYDTATGTWSALPAFPQALGSVCSSQTGQGTATCVGGQVPLAGGTGVCGMSAIGGETSGQAATVFVYHLPGYGNCAGDTGQPWLSSATPATVAPGQTVKLTLTVNPADRSVTQPGTYVAHLALDQDTPYDITPVDLTATITPAASWVKVTGTVTGSNCYGTTTPVAGATIQVQRAGSGTPVTELQTGAAGGYAVWIDASKPVQILVSSDGWQPRLLSLAQAGAITLATDFPCATSTTQQSTTHATGGSR